MSKQEFMEADAEVINMVNPATAKRRALREQEAARAAEQARLNEDAGYTGASGDLDIHRALPWVAAVALFVLALLLGRMM